ncbi:MAG: ATP-grasp domain-containing protein [Planctomycetes bacterium]|nr:ATP-grasp domain-containing protein [Planctomycetota bacterium]
MHVLFLAPDTNVYNLRFVDALKRAGARVSGVGHTPAAKLRNHLKARLDRYEQARSLLDDSEILKFARQIDSASKLERIETIDEPFVVGAARLREALAVPGLSVARAVLCRDKAAMKDALRARDIPCAASTAAIDREAVITFAEREGYPLVIKPREGFGTLDTFRVENRRELDAALERLRPSETRALIVEEFIDGHEGFYDTITAGTQIAHRFIGHYYPSCLAALQDRAISPQIAVTNRTALETYAELHEVAARVNAALGLENTATHMEWFFGSKGLKVSEIGARPAGERIWDMHAAGNEFDLYLSWAQAVLHGRAEGTPSQKYATGSVQIRPPKDGRYGGHRGIEIVQRTLAGSIIESEIPPRGAPTQPLERGWHQNTWFRLKDENYDRLREKLDFLARTVKVDVL